LRSRGLRVERVDEAGVRGEWIEPHDAVPGAIFYIHGGGYVACSARTHRPLTSALARLTRRPVLSVDYRLAPENRFPAAFDDTLAAYLWMIDQIGGDTSELAVGGDSAGGGLALALLVAARDQSIPLPACAFLFSPWTDMAGSQEVDHPNAERCAMFAVSNFDEFARAYLGDASPLDPRASPLAADLTGLPPLLLQVGALELPLEDSTQLHSRIAAAGGVSELQVWPNVFHGWQMMDGLLPEAAAALKETAKFIEANLPAQTEINVEG
jgi:acetyl esterase/lipase